MIIVGGGLAGSVAATVLARQGVRVTLVDPFVTYPERFKAEKLEPDQAALLQKFGLLEAFYPRSERIHEIHIALDGPPRRRKRREQFGIVYHEMVNSARAALSPDVKLIVGRVCDVESGDEVQRVRLESGEQHTSRLVVVACGTDSDLLSRLGVRKEAVRHEHSVAFGFDIAPTDAPRFSFDALTFYPRSGAARVAYLTLFALRDTMRANLFTYWRLRDETTRRFVKEPRRELSCHLPRLANAIGNFEIGPVLTRRIDLYRVEGHIRPGLILLADAYMSVCPVTGKGVSKLLTDVDVLCNDCVPRWLASFGMGVEKIMMFYDNPRKRQADSASFRDSLFGRRVATEDSLLVQAARVYRHWKLQWSG